MNEILITFNLVLQVLIGCIAWRAAKEAGSAARRAKRIETEVVSIPPKIVEDVVKKIGGNGTLPKTGPWTHETM